MQELFLVKEQGNYNSRNQTDVVVSESYGSESIRVLRPKIKESLPNDFKK